MIQYRNYQHFLAEIKDNWVFVSIMEHLCRLPKRRIAVLIGKGGETRKMIEEAIGGKLAIDSKSGDVSIDWDGDPDPVKRMKIPELVSAIGRGISPERAIKLIEDDVFLQMYDIREWVGRRPNQTRRMKGRLIGRNGRIRTLIEEISGCEIAIFGSTVSVMGDSDGLALASTAVEGILGGSEHSTVLFGLEQDKKRQRLSSKSLEMFEERGRSRGKTFEEMVPGLAEARERKSIISDISDDSEEVDFLSEEE